MEESTLLNSKRHIYVYNELTLLKKKLQKAHITDSVYESKIKSEKVANFSKTIPDVSVARKRTVSNVNETTSIAQVETDLDNQRIKAQNRGAKHYYPDGKKAPEDNFGLNR